MPRGLHPALMGVFLLLIAVAPAVAWTAGRASVRPPSPGDMLSVRSGTPKALASPLSVQARTEGGGRCELRPGFMARRDGGAFLSSVRDDGTVSVTWRGGDTAVGRDSCPRDENLTIAARDWSQMQRVFRQD